MVTWRELKDNPRLKDVFDKKMDAVKAVRDFFWENGFKEAITPTALVSTDQEKYFDPIPVYFHEPNGTEHRLFLATSPEIGLKKLLAAGWTKIFQILQVFRDYEEFGNTHNPEFTMIEWYRGPGTYWEIMDDVENLYKYVAKKLGVERLKYKEREIEIFTKWDRISMKELWQKHVGIDLDEYLTAEKMKQLAKDRGYQVKDDDTYESNFYKIFLNEIESKLGVDRPVFVYSFPALLASLCQDDPEYEGYVERFEFYVNGLELGNAYGELNDGKLQAQHLNENFEFRKKIGKILYPVDEDFNQAVGESMSKAGGIAIGIDRMIMLMTGAKDINEVIFESAKDQTERYK